MDVDVAALAKLARLQVTDAELAQLGKEIPDILKFVETIQKAGMPAKPAAPKHRNVMRADENPHESGEYTERMLEAAPNRKGDRIEVKRIINK